jgi:hypothetical protein
MKKTCDLNWDDPKTTVESAFDAVTGAKNSYITAKDEYDKAVAAVSEKGKLHEVAKGAFDDAIVSEPTSANQVCTTAKSTYDGAKAAVSENTKTRKHSKELVEYLKCFIEKMLDGTATTGEHDTCKTANVDTSDQDITMSDMSACETVEQLKAKWGPVSWTPTETTCASIGSGTGSYGLTQTWTTRNDPTCQTHRCQQLKAAAEKGGNAMRPGNGKCKLECPVSKDEYTERSKSTEDTAGIIRPCYTWLGSHKMEGDGKLHDNAYWQAKIEKKCNEEPTCLAFNFAQDAPGGTVETATWVSVAYTAYCSTRSDFCNIVPQFWSTDSRKNIQTNGHARKQPGYEDPHFTENELKPSRWFSDNTKTDYHQFCFVKGL